MKTYRILIVVLLLILSGCAPASNAVETEVPAAMRTASTKMPSSVASVPSPIPTARTSAVQTPQVVTVTAVKGNLFIRRGPDLAYNAVSVLMDGESQKALARDVLGKWLQIPIPRNPKETGWVSIQTRYSVVSGDVMNLPDIIPTDWPDQAWLRNCTDHQMEVRPGGIIILAVNRFPDNEEQINPGIYTVHDIEVEGSPEVLEIEIKEGLQSYILDDGNGNHTLCAIP